ncbi:MAG: hypothetical protein R2838_13290 [Caldilineaceae bacterium]
MVKLKQEPQDYAMLADENAVPRTTYRKRIYNPNEQLHLRNRESKGLP